MLKSYSSAPRLKSPSVSQFIPGSLLTIVPHETGVLGSLGTRYTANVFSYASLNTLLATYYVTRLGGY